METRNAAVSAAALDDRSTTGSRDDKEMPEKATTAQPTASPAQPTELTIVPPGWGFQHRGHLKAFLGILCFIAPETIPEELYADLLPSRLCYATDAQEFAFSIRFREAPGDLEYSKLAQAPEDVRQHWDCTIPREVQEGWLRKIGGGEGYQAAFAETASLFNDLFPPPVRGQYLPYQFEQCRRFDRQAVALAAHYPRWGDGYPEVEATEDFVSLMANVALFLFEVGDCVEDLGQVIDKALYAYGLKGLYAYGALGDDIGVHVIHAQLQRLAGLDAEDRGYFEGALIHFRACYRILQMLSERAERDSVELSEALYNIAVTYANLDKWDNCLYYCQLSLDALDTLRDGLLKQQMFRKRTIMVARYFIACGRLDEAYEILQDSFRYFGRKNETFPRDASLRKKPVEKNWLMQANVFFALGHYWRAHSRSGQNHCFGAAAFQHRLGRSSKLTKNRLEERVFGYQSSRDIWAMARKDLESGVKNPGINVNCAITQARFTVKAFEEAGDRDSIHRARADFLLAEALALDQTQDTSEERTRLKVAAMGTLKRLHPEFEPDLEPSFESLDSVITIRLR